MPRLRAWGPWRLDHPRFHNEGLPDRRVSAAYGVPLGLWRQPKRKLEPQTWVGDLQK
jgi:hypothetical protein